MPFWLQGRNLSYNQFFGGGRENIAPYFTFNPVQGVGQVAIIYYK